ncbi:MAG: hypothetical protein DDT25_01249 [Chloroflexi bacterium]|nr:hypothetical protein [Chloroflexota bacterium]
MVNQQPHFRLREVTVKSIISASKLADYALNPYAGCQHGCVYCHARFATRFSHPNEEWGSFVDVRVNAPQLIEREARRNRPGGVFISSVSDGWQPMEERYQITRQCLEALIKHHYAITIQTKSVLVRRDFDLLEGHPSVELGMTLTTTEAEVAALFEPGAPAPEERIEMLSGANRIGICTFVFLGPLLPYISDRGKGLKDLLDTIVRVNPDYFLVDRLNPRYGIWPSLSAAVAKYDPALVPKYREILYDRQIRECYTRKLYQRIITEARQHGLTDKLRPCF